MTVTDQHPPSSPSSDRRRRTRDLVLHYLATIAAMAVGMVALHPLWDLVLGVNLRGVELFLFDRQGCYVRRYQSVFWENQEVLADLKQLTLEGASSAGR